MAITRVADVEEQAQKFWAPMFMKELKEKTILPTLVNKDYSGDLKRGGDTVFVTQLTRPSAQLKSIGVDSDSFDSEKMVTQRIAIRADKRIVTSFEVEDLVDLQTQLDQDNPEIRRVMLEAVEMKLNSYLYSFIAPSASAPDHILSGVTDFNASQLLAVRALAAQSKWTTEKGWWLLQSPSFFNDLLSAQTLTSKDYVGDETPVIGGQISNRRFGFNVLEDNSDGLLSLSPAAAGTDCALAFHPDFLHLVMGEPRIKVSDQHSAKRFGAVISLDFWVGAKLGHDAGLKHISIYNT